jgi:hypothetical protein
VWRKFEPHSVRFVDEALCELVACDAEWFDQAAKGIREALNPAEAIRVSIKREQFDLGNVSRTC